MGRIWKRIKKKAVTIKYALIATGIIASFSYGIPSIFDKYTNMRNYANLFIQTFKTSQYTENYDTFFAHHITKVKSKSLFDTISNEKYENTLSKFTPLNITPLFSCAKFEEVLKVSSKGSYILSYDSHKKRNILYDLNNNKRITIGGSSIFFNTSFSPDQSILFIYGYPDSAHGTFLNTNNFATQTFPNPVNSIWKNQHEMISSYIEGNISTITLRTFEYAKNLCKVRGSLGMIASTPKGIFFESWDQRNSTEFFNGALYKIEKDTPVKIRDLPEPLTPSTCSPDGNRYARYTRLNQIELFDLNSKKLEHIIIYEPHKRSTRLRELEMAKSVNFPIISFSPDSKTICFQEGIIEVDTEDANVSVILENKHIRRISQPNHKEYFQSWISPNQIAAICMQDDKYKGIASINIHTRQHSIINYTNLDYPFNNLDLISILFGVYLCTLGWIGFQRFPHDQRESLRCNTLTRICSTPLDILAEYPFITSIVASSYFFYSNLPYKIDYTIQSLLNFSDLRIAPLLFTPCIGYLTYYLVNIAGVFRKPKLYSMSTLFLSHQQVMALPNLSKIIAEDDMVMEFPIVRNFRQALLSFYSGQFGNAFTLYEQASISTKFNSLAISFYSQRIWQKQYQATQAYINEHPSDIGALLSTEVLALQLGKNQEALDLASRCIDTIPLKTEVYLLQGRILKDANPQKSLEYLLNAASLIMTDTKLQRDSLGEHGHPVFVYTGREYINRAFAFKTHDSDVLAKQEYKNTLAYYEDDYDEKYHVVEPIGVLQHNEKQILVTTYIPGETLYERIKSRTIKQDEYLTAARFIAQLHKIKIPSTPRPINLSLEKRISDINVPHNIKKQALTLMNELKPYLETVPQAPNQDAHPDNFILQNNKIYSLDKGSAHETLPVTCDIASLILFDSKLSSQDILTIGRCYYDSSRLAKKITFPVYTKSLIAAVYYRSLYMSGLWSSRVIHQSLRKDILENAGKIITTLNRDKDPTIECAAQILNTLISHL
ncbi:MAG: hypothetical protein AABX52_03545 [Nanoarchaeota archaeon]